jgi:hypothetical protein
MAELTFTTALCLRCKRRTKNHPQCSLCTVLLHNNNKKYLCRCGKQHTLRSERMPNRCIDCETIDETKIKKHYR